MTQKDKIKLLEKEVKLLERKNQLLENTTKINELIKEEPKLEVDKWHFIKSVYNWLIYITKDEDGEVYGYGFDLDDDERLYEQFVIRSSSIKKSHLATDKEVEEALIKEAKKRGFYKDVKFIALRDTKENEDGKCHYYSKNTAECSSFEFTNGILYTIGYGRFVVFEKGKWAEIIEETKPTIAGYEMEVDGGYIKFGCISWSLSYIKDLNRIFCLNHNPNKITSFKIDNEYEVTVEQLKEIVDYIK